MSIKKDMSTLGSVYGDMLNGLRRELVKEGKTGKDIPVGEIGSAELVKDTGPTERGGFVPAKVDIEKLSDKEKEENLYDIKRFTYGKGNVPCKLDTDEDEEDESEELNEYENEEDDGEEDEEIPQDLVKIVKEGLNNFMRKKSVFDRLYDKVMVSENYGAPEMEEQEGGDLEALGLDDATPDDELGSEGEVTLTLDKETAQKLHDLLMTALGGEEGDHEGEAEGEFEFEGGEEDEEDFDAGSSLNTKYNDGKQNKVGTIKTTGAGQASAKGVSYKQDAGSNLNTKYNDGKQNKVGNLKPGHGAFEH